MADLAWNQFKLSRLLDPVSNTYVTHSLHTRLALLQLAAMLCATMGIQSNMACCRWRGLCMADLA